MRARPANSSLELTRGPFPGTEKAKHGGTPAAHRSLRTFVKSWRPARRGEAGSLGVGFGARRPVVDSHFMYSRATSAESLGDGCEPASRRTRRQGETMANTDSHVTIHMAASLDGFIARKDGSVDWLDTSDEFVGGDTMAPGSVEAFLKTIDCYVMGSRTYETALRFEAQGLGRSYGDKPTFVLTRRELPRTRDTVEFHSGDLAQFVNGRLRPTYHTTRFVGGGMV